MTLDKLNKLGYDNLRALHNVTDKVNIMSCIIYAREDDKKYANFMYGDGITSVVKELADKEIVFDTAWDNKNVLECIKLMQDSIISIDDSDGYYKALYDGDGYAQAIYEICGEVKSNTIK